MVVQCCSGIAGAFKSFGRQLQSALPIVGLISRLAATSGGIGNDEIVSHLKHFRPCNHPKKAFLG